MQPNLCGGERESRSWGQAAQDRHPGLIPAWSTAGTRTKHPHEHPSHTPLSQLLSPPLPLPSKAETAARPCLSTQALGDAGRQDGALCPQNLSEKLRHLKGSLLLGTGVGGLGWRTLFPKKMPKGLVSREGLNKSFGKIIPRHAEKRPGLAFTLCPPVDNIILRFSHRNRKLVL